MSEANTTTIECPNGTTLEVTTSPFTPVAALKLLAQIGKVIVPTVLAARGVSGKSDALDLMPAARALFEQMTPDYAVEGVCSILAASSVIRRNAAGEAAPIIALSNQKAIDRAFIGCGLTALLTAAKHSLEVNFGSFFAGLVPAVAADAPAADAAPVADESP